MTEPPARAGSTGGHPRRGPDPARRAGAPRARREHRFRPPPCRQVLDTVMRRSQHPVRRVLVRALSRTEHQVSTGQCSGGPHAQNYHEPPRSGGVAGRRGRGRRVVLAGCGGNGIVGRHGGHRRCRPVRHDRRHDAHRRPVRHLRLQGERALRTPTRRSARTSRSRRTTSSSRPTTGPSSRPGSPRAAVSTTSRRIEIGFVADVVQNHADQFVNFGTPSPTPPRCKAEFYAWKWQQATHHRRHEHRRPRHRHRARGDLLPPRPAQAGRPAVRPGRRWPRSGRPGTTSSTSASSTRRRRPSQAGSQLRRQRGEHLLHRRLPGQRGLRQRRRQARRREQRRRARRPGSTRPRPRRTASPPGSQQFTPDVEQGVLVAARSPRSPAPPG